MSAARVSKARKADPALWRVIDELRQATVELEAFPAADAAQPRLERLQARLAAWADQLEGTQQAFIEDVYTQCADAIAPLVNKGVLPGSVVESVQMLVSMFGKVRPEDVTATSPDPAPISLKAWREAAKQFYLDAGDDDATASECAAWLASQQDWFGDEVEEPAQAALADLRERPKPYTAVSPAPIGRVASDGAVQRFVDFTAIPCDTLIYRGVPGSEAVSTGSSAGTQEAHA